MQLLQLTQSLGRPKGQKRKFSSGESWRAFLRGKEAMEQRDWAAGAAAYAEALVGAPKWAALWVQYGHALKESGRREEAEKAYLRALALEPDKADTHLQLGHVLKLLGRADEAVLAYLRAAELDPTCSDPWNEVDYLANRGATVPIERLQAAMLGLDSDDFDEWTDSPAELDPVQTDIETVAQALERLVATDTLVCGEAEAIKAAFEKLKLRKEADEKETPLTNHQLVFDVADLIAYFRNARLPTGIQRVQIEVVCGMLRGAQTAGQVRVCSFSESHDDWVEIPARLFLRLGDLSLSGGDVKDDDWVATLRRLDLLLRTSRPLEFSDAACLVNLGTSWWLQNYFLNVRRVKARHKISYVPFVHDLIPIMTPEHCIRELSQDFITWILGVFQHADMYLANSQATKRDLLAVAAILGHNVSASEVEVVPLDADFRRPVNLSGGELVLQRWGLKPGNFVLMVSTIESRKNHIGAFNAWLSLIRKHGPNATPTLVCVGNAGWLNDAVHAKLSSSDLLRSKVKMLSRLSDEELATLYQNSLFTLYPSHYEGWGLPITESFCYGKVALVSDSSSLPEAGGIFADYFPAGSDTGLAAAAEKLIFDRAHRTSREKLIADEFKPRPWSDVGRQIETAVARLHVATEGATHLKELRATEPMSARLGFYYPIVRNYELRIWRGMVLGEMFRMGSGWWWPDDWGVWTKPAGGEVAIQIEGPHKALRAYFQIRGIIESGCTWTFEFATQEGERRLSGHLGPDEFQWVTIDFPALAGNLTISGKLGCDLTQDFGGKAAGLDNRVTGIGLAGFFVCELDDLSGRVALTEAIATRNFLPLTVGYDARPD